MRDIFPLCVKMLSLQGDSRHLLDNISFMLQADSVTVIMGANGAGKSLLLRLLHGLIHPTSGQILWNDNAFTLEVRQRQAMLFQRPVLFRRSVAANVDFALSLNHASTSLDKETLLEEVGLSDLADRPARLLSGGEQQRLAWARAIATSPDVLFLDEATANLDPASVQLLETLIRRKHTEGTKIILVTHDIGQARRLANDVLFLHAGKLQEHTEAARFFNSPDTAAAQAYLNGQLYV